MGVPGLTTFIDANPHLLTSLHLHNTHIIIDGNNLCHFLYYYYHVRHECAGDYDRYRSCCESFFAALEECRITPYVVFDGAHHADERKFSTSLKRAEERVHLAGFLSVGNRAKILPILAYKTFRDACSEAGVSHVTCYLEADEQIAGLAQRWCCPVLTNDSDFFVYDLPGGVILLDYINLSVKKFKTVEKFDDNEGKVGSTEKHGKTEDERSNFAENSQSNITASELSRGLSGHSDKFFINSSQNYLNVQIFYTKNLQNMFRFKDRKMIPLAATLVGNDLISRSRFESFYAKAKLVCSANPKKGARAGLIGSVFRWLKQFDDAESALKQILEHIDKDKWEKIKRLIEESINSYSNLSCSIVEFPDGVFPEHAPVSKSGRSLPEWFLSAHRAGAIEVRALSAITRRKVILLAQIEVMSNPSAYDCAVFLRCVFYSILLSVDQGAGDDLFVVEHDREEKTMKRKKINVVSEICPGLPVPQLWDIPELSEDYRFGMLVAALTSSARRSLKNPQLQGLPKDVQVFVLTVVYWVLHAKPLVSEVHMRAIVVCALCLGAFDDWILSEGRKPEVVVSEDKFCKNDMDGASDVLCEVVELNKNNVETDRINKGRESIASSTISETSALSAKFYENATSIQDYRVQDSEECMRDSSVPNISTESCNNTITYQDSNQIDQGLAASLSHTTISVKSTKCSESVANNDVYQSVTELISEALALIKSSLIERFAPAPVINKAHVFNGHIIHAFSQFQACLQTTVFLQELLLLPSFRSLIPANVFNGTVLYNLTQELKSRPNPDLYIEELLGRGRSIAAKFSQIMRVVVSILPPGSLLEMVRPVGTVWQIKRAGSKKDDASCSSRSEEAEPSDCGVSDDCDEMCETVFDANNKFSCLGLLKSDDV